MAWKVELTETDTGEPYIGPTHLLSALDPQPYVSFEISKDGHTVLRLERCQTMTFTRLLPKLEEALNKIPEE